MPTNPNRHVVLTRDVGFLRVNVFNTGAVYFNWHERGQKVLLITQANDLVASGHIWKLADILLNEETSHIQSQFGYRGITLEYTEARSEQVKFILDSFLTDEAKLIYLMSLQALRVPLSIETLKMIFSKRPNPREEWESRISPNAKNSIVDLVTHALTPGFYYYNRGVNSEEEFRRVSVLSAFLNSEHAITYGDFKEKHKDDFFIPHRALNARSEEFHPVSDQLTNDLYPAEFSRFMSYFGAQVPSELRSWARARFDSGVETFKEAKLKGKAKLQPGNVSGWMEVINLLTVEEADRFQAVLKKSNGIGSNFLQADKKVSALLAYYFAEGGEERLNELMIHLLANGARPQQDYFQGMRLRDNGWRNPYRSSNTSKEKYAPYVLALREAQKDQLPLEWVLATS